MAKILYIFLIQCSLIISVPLAEGFAINYPDTAYRVFEQNGKKGIKSTDGQILLEAKYQDLGWSGKYRASTSSYLGFKKNEKWGLMDENFIEQTEAKFKSLIPFQENLFIASLEGRYSKTEFYGIIDEKGNRKIDFSYRNLIPADENLIAAAKIGQNIYFGVISKTGKILSPFDYYTINYLGHNNYELSTAGKKRELIKIDGKVEVLFHDADSVSEFREGVAIVFQNGAQGLIRQDGKLLLPAHYKKIEWNDGKEIYITQLDAWDIIHQNGIIKSTLKADSIFYLNDSLIVKNVSNHAEITNLNNKAYSKHFNGQVMGVFGKYYLLNQKGLTVLSEDTILSKGLKFSGKTAWNQHFFVAEQKTYDGKKYQLINRQSKSIQVDSFKLLNDKIVVKKKNYWGLLDYNFQEILPCLYDDIISFDSAGILVKFKGKFGLLDDQNNWILSPSYLKISKFKNNHYILVDQYLRESLYSDRILSEADLHYNHLGNFIIETNPSGDSRLVDDSGQPLTAYFKAKYQSHGKAGILFQNGNTHSLRSYNGKIIFEISGYDSIKIVDDEYFPIVKNGQYGFINQEGVLRVANRYDEVKPFSNDLSAVRIRGSWGYIDRSEQLVLQPYYSFASNFNNGIALVKYENKLGLINKKGEYIIEPNYDSIIYTNGIYLLQKKGKYGVAGNDGKTYFYPSFDEIKIFKNFIIVEKYGTKRILDIKGNNIVDMQHELILFNEAQKAFLAKRLGKRIPVYLTDILRGELPSP